MASYKELVDQIEALKQQAESQRRAELAVVISDIKAKMQEYGITAEDLGGARRRDTGKVVAPKYRDKITGDTWTGRGKMPRWMASQVAAGKTKEDFAI